MQYFPWDERLRIFKGTLDRVLGGLEFRSIHERNTIAKILEQKAMFLRFENDELLPNTAEVPTKEEPLRRSAALIDSGRGRLPSITLE